MADDAPRLKRPPFSKPQLIQTDNVGRVTEEHKRQRPTVTTHAIDNVTPEILADRDDGIRVEVAPAAGKGYRAHITIADVAAHVRPHSHLSNAAWQRAYTVYHADGTDPMFPKILEGNLSLEHGQERLGLAVNITLDEHFKPTHTSFTPVVTKADNASYEQAHTLIATNPQFGLMAKIAKGIEQQCRTMNSQAWYELVEDRHQHSGRSDSEIKTMDMVAAYMLLANNCVAEFASKSKMPFLYRNFDEGRDAHATYSTEARGHTAIESMGFQGAYCHVTSPIRRGPDYFNGAMMHYAVDVLTHVTDQTTHAYPAADPQKLEETIWKHGPEIIQLATTTQPSIARNRASLDRLLNIAAKESSPNDKQPTRCANIASRLHLPEMPYSKSELDAYAAHINALAHSPEKAQAAKSQRDEQKLTSYRDSLKSIEDKDEDSMRGLQPADFSRILHAAAVTGELPDNLLKEAELRIEDRNSHNTNDLFNVFIRAQYPTSERWKTLKRVAAREIKKNPSAVNSLLPMLAQLIEPAKIHYLSDSITIPDGIGHNEKRDEGVHTGAQADGPSLKTEDPLASLGRQGELELAAPYASDTIRRPDRINRALIVIESTDGSKRAAPFYSVGHNERAARSHACYSLLEYYAFGQLQPVEQATTPSLLYAQLHNDGTKKRELVEQMVHNAGAEIKVRTKPNFEDNGRIATIAVSGGDFPTPIIRTGKGMTEDAAIDSALGHILRNDTFKTITSRHDAIGQELLNPQIVLAEELTKRGASVEFTATPVSPRSSDGFRAVATIHFKNGTKEMFPGEGPNKDRATRAAAVLALESIGTARPSVPAHVASWVLNAHDPLGPAGNKTGRG